jgi:hypothetical protein
MESNFSNINQIQFPSQALNNQNNSSSPELIFNNSVVNINKPILSYYHKSISREEIELDKNNIKFHDRLLAIRNSENIKSC